MPFIKIKKPFFLLLILFFFIPIKIKTIANHNEILPYTSGPGPLFSFGLNVQAKNGFVYRQIYSFEEHDFNSVMTLHNHIYYGITDRLTLVIKQPIILKQEISNGVVESVPVDGFFSHKNSTKALITSDGSSTGSSSKTINNRCLANTRIELETIPYVFEIPDEYRFRTTTVSGFVIPDNTGKVETLITLKSLSIFLGATQSNATPHIFQYSGLFFLIPTKRKNDSNFNYSIYYEMGFAHAIKNSEKAYFGIDFEMFGIYQKSHRVNGVTDFTTGGNTMFFGASFRFSMEHCIIQVGLQYPWIRHDKIVVKDPINYRFAYAMAIRY